MRFTSKLLPSLSGNLGIIQLNHPKALHALTLDMIHAFSDVMDEWDDPTSNPKAILVRSTPAKRPAFCAGGDVKAIYEEQVGATTTTAEHASPPGYGTPGRVSSDFFRYEYQLNYKIAKCRKPYISIWDGVVMGGGVGISIHGRYRVATEHTVFSMPETALGLFPDVGSTYWMPRLSPSTALCHYLALTGTRLKAADLIYSGLATHYVPASRLDELQKALVDATTTSTATSTTDPIGPVLASFHTMPQFPTPIQSFLAKNELGINQVFAGQTMEEIFEACQSSSSSSSSVSSDQFRDETKKILEKMSPTSLKLTLEGMQRGALLTRIEDCFRMEFRMGQACLKEGSDFYEGVRAVLVDKDQSPKWNPASLAEVSEERVASYFAPLPDPSHEWHPAKRIHAK